MAFSNDESQETQRILAAAQRARLVLASSRQRVANTLPPDALRQEVTRLADTLEELLTGIEHVHLGTEFTEDEKRRLVELAGHAQDVRSKALQQVQTAHGGNMPMDPDDETTAHRMLDVYFRHWEAKAAERNAPAIGGEIARQRRDWEREGRLTGLGPTWLLKFATEAELTAITERLEGRGDDEEIIRTTFARAAVKRWLTAQGHVINESETLPKW
ncbi:hypothetical protein ACFV4X_12795 [Streptomyces ardesiacus]|uniref:hypothetical protein n=1 Tax=Streptomyces ardesiacus TaxID=285564 RepID=UPI00365BFA88